VDLEDLAGGDGLTHVADGEGTEFGDLAGRLDAKGFCGRIVTTAASPDWMKSGFSSATSPLEESIFWSMDSIVQATCAV